MVFVSSLTRSIVRGVTIARQASQLTRFADLARTRLFVKLELVELLQRGSFFKREGLLMNRVLPGVVWLLVGVAAGGCGDASGQAEPAAKQSVREPAVAGLFYPAAAKDLSGQLQALLAKAEPVPLGKLRGLVCPHAGYEFSGLTAACAYKQVAPRGFDTVIVLAPSHYADFEGVSVANVEAYATPLGRIPLSPRAAKLAAVPPFCRDPRCDVSRPSWWRQASKEVPPFGEDTPHTWEHSLEVQLPFLQTLLKDFQLIPAVFGRADAQQAAAALADFIDDRTLVVASSDLSHFYPEDIANQLDASCVRSISDLDVKWMQNEEACGKLPVLTLMHLAIKKGWKTRLLDTRNSGAVTHDRSNVVGYAAVAFFEGDGPSEYERVSAEKLTQREQQFLLDLARRSLDKAVRDQEQLEMPAAEVPERLRERGACFVTLTKKDELRGCIGHIFACRPLYQSVLENAKHAALEDRRFSPVGAEELDKISVEVSVLTTPRRLEYKSPDDLLAKLRPGIDGVVFGLRGERSTYLPQVWEQLPDKEQFLRQLALKAGLRADAWKNPEAAFLTYQVQAFKEGKK